MLYTQSLLLIHPCAICSPVSRQTIIIATDRMRLTAVKYALTAFRTKKTYLAFLILQLLLSITIVVLALTSNTHFRTPIVIGLEFALFLCLAFDLLIVRWISEGHLCQRKTNIFDLCLLCIFAATLIFLLISNNSPNKDYRELLQIDDIVIITLIITRYLIQLVRLINQIRNSHTNRKIQHAIKKVDLNAAEFNHSMNLDSVQVDNQVRARITASAHKDQLVQED